MKYILPFLLIFLNIANAQEVLDYYGNADYNYPKLVVQKIKNNAQFSIVEKYERVELKKYGIINSKNDTILPTIFSYCKEIDNNNFLLKIGNNNYIFNNKFQKVNEFLNTYVDKVDNPRFLFISSGIDNTLNNLYQQKGHKKIFSDSFIIEKLYHFQGWNVDDSLYRYFSVFNKYTKYKAIYDIKAEKFISNFIYTSISNLFNYTFIVSHSTKEKENNNHSNWGNSFTNFNIIDVKNNCINLLKENYDYISNSTNSTVILDKGLNKGLFNCSNNLLIPANFTSISILNEKEKTIYVAVKDSVVNIYNEDGSIVNKPYNGFINLNENSYLVKEKNKWGLKVGIENYTILPKYDSVKMWNNVCFLYNNKIDIINIERKSYFETQLDSIVLPKNSFTLDRFIAKKNDFYGVLELGRKLETILPFEYDSISLSYDYCTIFKKGLNGIFSFSTKKLIINTEFEDIKLIRENNNVYWQVKKNNKWGLYDNYGKMIYPIEYDIVGNDFYYIYLLKNNKLEKVDLR